MTKRERLLLSTILVLALLIVHLWAGQRYLTKHQAAQTELRNLQGTLNTYQHSGSTAELITDEVDWLSENTPQPSTIQDTQSQLQNFLITSSKSNGITPFGEKLIPLKESTGPFQKVKIQISARATESQLYKWLIQIHQPTSLRSVTYLKLTPDKNDDTQVIATLTAEQFLTLKQDDPSEQFEEEPETQEIKTLTPEEPTPAPQAPSNAPAEPAEVDKNLKSNPAP